MDRTTDNPNQWQSISGMEQQRIHIHDNMIYGWNNGKSKPNETVIHGWNIECSSDN